MSEAKYWAAYDTGWSGSNSVTYTGTALPGIAAQPKYVIEQLPGTMSAVTGSTNAGTATGMTVTDYRITARGVGLTTDAVVILQSVYRRTDP